MKTILKISVLFVCTFLFTGCALVFSLFYKDWTHEVAYRSSSSKKDYFVIEGVTQSHCGCSDVVVKNYKNKKLDFTFYYGGGLFPAKKYIYLHNAKNKTTDTLIYIPVSTNNYTTGFDSLDRVILQKIDSLIVRRPKGSGIGYKVKQHDYKGFIRQL